MTNSEKEKMLYRYNDLEISIRNLKDRWEEIYTASTKITPSYSNNSGGGSGSFDGSKVENACIKLLEVDLKKDKLINKKKAIENALRKMTYLQRKVITFIDIDHHSIYTCAKAFNRSYNDIKQIRQRAIDNMVIDI